MKARPRLSFSFQERISRVGPLEARPSRLVGACRRLGYDHDRPAGTPAGTALHDAIRRPMSNSRPNRPAYGWFLLAFRAAGGAASFVHLPLLQAAILAMVLLVFVVQATRLLQAPLIGAAMIPLIWANSSIYEAPSFLMSEALFLPCALAGLASALAFAQRDSLPTCRMGRDLDDFGMADPDAGGILLLVPVLLVVLDGRLSAVALVGRLALILGLVAPLRLAGMAANHAVNGSFEIGSYSGGVSAR